MLPEIPFTAQTIGAAICDRNHQEQVRNDTRGVSTSYKARRTYKVRGSQLGILTKKFRVVIKLRRTYFVSAPSFLHMQLVNAFS